VANKCSSFVDILPFQNSRKLVRQEKKKDI